MSKNMNKLGTKYANPYMGSIAEESIDESNALSSQPDRHNNGMHFTSL